MPNEHYNRWRYYDPNMGGYISPDPLGLLGGLRPYGYTSRSRLIWDKFTRTTLVPKE
ncbi:hypothetical protein G6O69_15255 [Pseudenhygromyxa sp. WMMC2535]|nr:hypothetical protein [Pseudenhygromyxa sp. WMMC2535]